MRKFELSDLPVIIDLLNRTAKNRSLYYPISERKIKSILLEKPTFDPEGFFIAEDDRGIVGGIIVSAIGTKDNCGRLEAIFTRTGKINTPVTHFLMEEALNYLKKKELKKVITTSLSDVDSKDLEMLEFLWFHRFIFPGVYDQLIDQNIASASTFLGKELEDFSIPNTILSLQSKLEKEGYKFQSYCLDKTKISLNIFKDFPFGHTFKQVIETNSPLENLVLVFHKDMVVGGALVSLPYAPTDWPMYGCDCGLFGPTGVFRQERGKGLGKVLLFQSINWLKEHNCHYVLIPTNPSTYPFYQKAGFEIVRVSIRMERVLGEVEVKFKEVA